MKKKGFTLIELLAAIAILSISAAGILAGFGSATKIGANGEFKLNASALADSTISIFKDQKGQGVKTIYDVNQVAGKCKITFKCSNTDSLNSALNLIMTKKDIKTNGNYEVILEIQPRSKSTPDYIEDYKIYNVNVKVNKRSISAVRLYDFVVPN